MKKKYLTLISTIIVLSIILVVTVLFKNKGYFLPRLKNIKNDITNITIVKNGDNSIVIKKDGDNWIIDGKYKAEKSFMEDMINVINGIKVSELVSRGSKEALEKYKLVSPEKINVKAFGDNNKELRDFSVGMKASFNYQVYGQIKNNKNIYLLEASQNPREVFDKTVDDLRNKTIVSIQTSAIDKVSIDTKNANYTIEKSITDTNTVYWQTDWKNSLPLDNTVVASSLLLLGNIKADGFLDSNIPKMPLLYKVDIVYTNGNISWSLFNKLENNLYEMSVENDDTRYYVSENVAVDIIKDIENIIK